MPTMPTLAEVEALRPRLAAAAQAVYDAWEQDEDGWDEELGSGGICHLVADAMVDVLYEALGDRVVAATKSVSDEVHVNVAVAVAEGVYELDVPWRVYESGGGYVWRKKPGVTIGEDDVVLFRLTADPGAFGDYVEDWGEPEYADEEPDADDAPGVPVFGRGPSWGL